MTKTFPIAMTVLGALALASCLKKSPTAPLELASISTSAPTSTVTPDPCAPVTMDVRPSDDYYGYGVTRKFVIRTQADWDDYINGSGDPPPVDLSVQMLLISNWSTEYGNGSCYVVGYAITSVCVFADRTEVILANPRPCSCAPSCYYWDAGTLVSAAVLPTSSLPVIW